MKEKIWRSLIQILYYRKDTSDIIKPFFENLKDENINDEKYLPLLQTLFQHQIEVLYQNEIIKKEKFDLLMSKFKKYLLFPHEENIEKIISGDNIKELQEFVQKKNISLFKRITKPFKEIKKMEIPIIHYCIMKNAINCFKYLLVNGLDDPNKFIAEQDPYGYGSHYKYIRKYEWDCMATAIYYGNKEIIHILENRGIEKGKNSKHIEAAILSYRNEIVEDLIDKINGKNEKNEETEKILNVGIITSAMNNNIKATEWLIKKGANISINDKHLN